MNFFKIDHCLQFSPVCYFGHVIFINKHSYISIERITLNNWHYNLCANSFVSIVPKNLLSKKKKYGIVIIILIVAEVQHFSLYAHTKKWTITKSFWISFCSPFPFLLYLILHLSVCSLDYFCIFLL